MFLARRSAGLLIALTIAPALLLTSPALASNPPVVMQGTKTFHDIAGPGLTKFDGREVQSDLVFRSNRLRKLSDADLAALTVANITLDVDLRNSSERGESPDRLTNGVEYRVADLVSIGHGLDSSFDTVSAAYGSFDNYVCQGPGIDQATINALKAKLLR